MHFIAPLCGSIVSILNRDGHKFWNSNQIKSTGARNYLFKSNHELLKTAANQIES